MTDIGLFRTTLKSFEREVYYVPNSLFSNIVVLNVTRKMKEWRVRTAGGFSITSTRPTLNR